jgi:hypothetical protein
MDWKNVVGGARDSGQQLFDAKSEVVMKEYWPKVQALFQEKVGPAALAAANDDKKMTTLFTVIYKALPFPVHLAVKEPVFVKFCFEHRNQLLPPGEQANSEAAGK